MSFVQYLDISIRVSTRKEKLLIINLAGQEDAMSCEDSSPDDRMSCDEDDLGHNLTTPLELQIPHILDNHGGDVGKDILKQEALAVNRTLWTL